MRSKRWYGITFLLKKEQVNMTQKHTSNTASQGKKLDENSTLWRTMEEA